MQLKYYLDTCAVQSLGAKLVSLPVDCFYTSVWTQFELVSAIIDENSFKRKRGALKHLFDSGLYIDQVFPVFKRLLAYGIVKEEEGEIHGFSNTIRSILQSTNYEEFVAKNEIHSSTIPSESIGLERITALEIIKRIDEVTLGFGNQIKSRMDLRIEDFEEKWEKGDKNEWLQDAIGYYASLLEAKSFVPRNILINAYDHSMDYYILIHYYYVEQKRYSRNQPAKNDFNDLMHLQYLRNGCKLVTDDKGFQKYVNKVVDGLAIGIEQFLKEISEQ